MGNPIKCILIDDEALARDNLRILLNTYCPNVLILGEGEDEKSLIKLCEEFKPDIVFCDIKFGERTIFELLSSLEELGFRIIFVSAFEKFALKGYKYEAIDYLLKPVDPILLLNAVNKYEKRARSNSHIEDTNTITKQGSMIILSDNQGAHIVRTDDIKYCIADGNYTTVFLKDRSKIVISKKLKEIEEKLSLSNDFLRIHKSNIINVNYVKLLSNKEGGFVVMDDEKLLSISRDKKNILLSKIEQK